MLRSLTYPVLGAVGIEAQCVEAAWCAGDLGFDLAAQHAVGHRGPVAHRQNLQEEAPQSHTHNNYASLLASSRAALSIKAN